MGRPATNLRSDRFMLPVLELHSVETERIAAELGQKVKQAPGFFRNAPVVVDCKHLPPDQPLDLPVLVRLMRSLALNPVAVRGGSSGRAQAVREVGLTVLPEPARERREPPAAEPAVAGDAAGGRARADAGPAEPKPVGRQEPAAVNVTHMRPVRSGQQIAAPAGDLTVTASTSAGSELLAAGNIHVYGALRGRAIAGAYGDESRRIFCLGLDAELVSVAGTYRVSEDIGDRFRGRAAQVYRDGDRLEIALLGSPVRRAG